MNVLLTSVGRRSYLVRYFQEVLAGRGQVLVTNTTAAASGMQAANRSFVVPSSHTPGYVDTIALLCREFHVGLLCSCHDLDTWALAAGRTRLSLESGVMMLPSQEWASLCLDKYACGIRLREAGIAVPWSTLTLADAVRTARHGSVCYPLVVKARYGFGSLGLAICPDEASLKYAYRSAVSRLDDSIIRQHLGISAQDSVLIQEHIDGPDLCVILANDFSGKHAAHFITEVHAMRAGESDWATTRDPGMLGDLPMRLTALTGHKGVWGVDVRLGNGQPKVIDVNPRFTGDYPFQHLAGANLPAALIAWAQNKIPETIWLRSRPDVSGYKDLVPTPYRQQERQERNRV
jgi:carbamoyl-phosphate synthase large subunit